ncbi:tRNA lysidine(34) synthetase TilS [Bacillus sp. FJAT-45350]|uniref:tRNA lysidine(34) synthetase TilS n=1 Tax=Bacillus sp. FJAT-45350 TaxID=2011014 RepID=UPI000BB80537|nr:tRNA lysidine(34) synthetase TilS [Bacillus sp. FJAT-45350]
MNQTVNQFISNHHLLSDHSTVIVGVSGGPDSLALLHFLWNERTKRKLRIIAAHIDHMFRGETSYADYQFVEQFCLERKIEFEGIQVDVKAYQKEKQLSSQMAARECRYQFFSDVMIKYQGDYLALAHHGDDQVETMLMKQVRGTYGFGSAGIPVSRPFATGEIIRPFLEITKKEIEEYCERFLLNPRIDETNKTDAYIRNRFRNHILPILKEENPKVHLQFQKKSEWITEDEHFLEELTVKEKQRIILKEVPDQVSVCVQSFNDIAIPLQRRVIHLILRYLYGKNSPIVVTSIHIEAVSQLLKEKNVSGRVDLPNGLQVKRSYGNCLFSLVPDDDIQEYEEILTVPGMVHLNLGKISVEVLEQLPERNSNELCFVCDMEQIELPLTIRTKKPGDRIKQVGMSGTKKINRIFIDKKVGKMERAMWPIIVDNSGRILWVPLLSRSSTAVVTEQTKKYLVLRFEPKSTNC